MASDETDTRKTADGGANSLRHDILNNQTIIDELNAKIRRKNDEIKIIQQISSEINSSLDLDRILEAILRASDEVLGFDHAMILLADPAAAILTLAACRGYDDPPIGLETAVGTGVIGVVAKRRRMMRIGNLRTQRAYVQAVRTRSQDADSGPAKDVVLPGLADAQSQLAIPLVVQDRLVGVFAVESDAASKFDELDEVLLTIVANQVANAIDNARLHESEVERSKLLDVANAELSRLNETLESKVEERTAELSQALEQIRTEKELTENLLKRMAPPEVVPLMLQSNLVPRRLVASILFVDLEGFTSFTAGMEPDEVFARLNNFFSWAGDVIRRHRGYLNKTMGDGLMALFGVPDESPTHALDAVLAALILQREIGDVLPLKMRIGISSGPITTGLLGPTDKAMYDVLSANVNEASRIESICETGTVTMAESTYNLVKAHFAIEELGPQELKGVDPVECYRALWLKPLLEDARRVDPTSEFARSYAACADETARIRDDDLGAVNFVSIQSRDGAMGHNGAVASMALALLRKLAAAEGDASAAYREIDETDLLRIALLHDIGKHAVEPRKLNATNLDQRGRGELRAQLKSATVDALGKLELPQYADAIGKLYEFEARGGSADGVPALVEIVCLADIYDALTAPKIYKGASWRIGGALEELLRLPRYAKGESEIVRAFVDMMRPEAETIARRRKVNTILQ